MSRECRIERYLTAYADGALSERKRRRVESHIARCESCARQLDSIRSFDRMLREVPTAPAVPDEKWSRFHRLLSQELDRVERRAERANRLRESRPVFGDVKRRVLTFAGVGVAAAAVLLVVWSGGLLPGGGTAGNACVVESLETYAAGYTPMAFTSDDPEMTVIWVFSEEVESGARGEGPAGR